ncbi:MAG: hypothetical protein LPL29_02210 [Alphaproteobacteria bacterium]|nr:hypothetical protein [Alphaproteobacteria bacterium]
MPLSASDIIVRTANTEPNKSEANSFVTLTEAENLAKFRLDALVWDTQSVDTKIRALASAYDEIIRLSFSHFGGRSQSRDYEFEDLFERENSPPLDDAEFVAAVKKAQVVQAIYLLGGTQVRDMAREGITMSRALSGSEMEFKGYRGPVCTEAKELLSRWIEVHLQTRRVV